MVFPCKLSCKRFVMLNLNKNNDHFYKNKTRYFLDAVWKHSIGYLFCPTATPKQPPQHTVISVASLFEKLTVYLPDNEIQQIKSAFQFSDDTHLGQYRQSGEPYITHPIAVAEMCADWRLDSSAIQAALLHDVMEDKGVTHIELVERFGHKVAELVEGLSKLSKIEFRNREERQAENFRKMMLAMAQDVRVIIIKLADRLHNLRTLSAVSLKKRRRIARETLDIYAPIAHRLGLNAISRDLEDTSFENFHPLRYRTLKKALEVGRAKRREVVDRIFETVKIALNNVYIEANVAVREKTVFSIYQKMKNKQLMFSEVLDVYGFRVIVKEVLHCYTVLGILHSLYKPLPGKIKDYIAIAKVNGYQSLHTTVLGPRGTPVEFQIRTNAMNEIAESGIAAHWMYKNGERSINDAQALAYSWVKSLIGPQHEHADSNEFMETLKIDLCPGSVYVFTPSADIKALVRGATALDFAYAVHTDLGHCSVSARINNELMPLSTELNSGDIVEIISAPYAKPRASWLGFVRTSKARSTIRHYLRTMQLNEAVELGKKLLEQSLKHYSLTLDELSDEHWQKLNLTIGKQTREEIFSDIGLGRHYAAIVAKRIQILVIGQDGGSNDGEILTECAQVLPKEAIEINGAEGMSVQFSTCCYPIPGDLIMGYIGIGLGMAIHRMDCKIAANLNRCDISRWIDVAWKPSLCVSHEEGDSTRIRRLFSVSINIVAKKYQGVFARIAALLSAFANVTQASIDDDHSEALTLLHFTIQVANRSHLAQVMRKVRVSRDVFRITREITLK